jgi:hypothetical protein
MRQNKIQALSIAALLAFGVSNAHAGQATVVSINEKCNLAVVQKPDEYGLVTMFSVNAASVGDVVDGDFDSIKFMRKAHNQTTGKDIMVRGVRYSSSRKIVESEIPSECKEATSAAPAAAAQ